MAGVDYIEKETDGILEYLDLSNANIVEGGDFYCFPENIYNHECYSENNVIGRFMFRKCNKKMKHTLLIPILLVFPDGVFVEVYPAQFSRSRLR